MLGLDGYGSSSEDEVEIKPTPPSQSTVRLSCNYLQNSTNSELGSVKNSHPLCRNNPSRTTVSSLHFLTRWPKLMRLHTDTALLF